MSKSNERHDIFALIHRYEYGEEQEYEEIKNLGVYTSYEKAEKAIERYYKLSGFCNYSKECFAIEEYFLDKDMWWNEGFTNTNKIEKEFEQLTLCFNEWLNIKKEIYDSWEDLAYYNTLCDVSRKMYKANSIYELATFIEQIWTMRDSDNSKSFDDYILIATKISKELSLDLKV